MRLVVQLPFGLLADLLREPRGSPDGSERKGDKAGEDAHRSGLSGERDEAVGGKWAGGLEAKPPLVCASELVDGRVELAQARVVDEKEDARGLALMTGTRDLERVCERF